MCLEGTGYGTGALLYYVNSGDLAQCSTLDPCCTGMGN